jgi:mono/diheme cytochrome c family protein
VSLSQVLTRAAVVSYALGCVAATYAQPAANAQAPKSPAVVNPQLASFFKQHCVECHGAKEPEAKVAVHNLAAKPQSPAELALWKRVIGQLESGHMPPDDAQQPSPQQRQQAIAALYAGLEQVGVIREGNEVDHEALFSGKQLSENITPRAATPGRLWRLSQPAYENLLRESFRGLRSASRVRAPWEMVPDPKTGFSDFASTHRIGEAELEHHLRNALPIVRDTMASKSPPLELAALTKAGKAATEEQIAGAVAAVFRRVLRREPTKTEQERYAGFVRKNLDAADAKVAIEQLYLAALLHPESLYRVEMAKEKPEVLTPHHLARAIAYTLTDQAPDAALLEAVAKNQLSAPEEVHAQVLRILRDPNTSKLRVLRFFQEYFGYTTAPDVFKDAPTLQAAKVVEDAKYTRKETEWAEAAYTFVRDADWLILDVIEQDRDVLRQLLTTRDTFTLTKSERGPRPLVAAEVQNAKRKYRENSTTRGFFRGIPVELRIYELDELAIRRDAWAPDRRYPMPAGHRAGILTHPAWLIAQSDNFDNSPIHRGKWIREKLLGAKLPEIPITVDAQLPDEPHNTLRERMRVTRETYCWKCHVQMDPLGLPFEMYDHFGRYRETELDKPVDTSGHLQGTGNPQLDGPAKNAVDLIERLAKSERVEQVFVRHVFRYFIGRNETLADGPTLVQAHRAYEESDGSLQALLASLLSSPAFLERMVETEPSQP